MIDEEYRGLLTAVRHSGMWQVSIYPLSVGQIVPKPRGRQTAQAVARECPRWGGIKRPVAIGGPYWVSAQIDCRGADPTVAVAMRRNRNASAETLEDWCREQSLVPLDAWRMIHRRGRRATTEGQSRRAQLHE